MQLEALNALTFLIDAAQPALVTIRRAAESEQEYVRDAARYLTAVLTGTYTPATRIFDLDRMMRRMREGGGAG